MSKCICKIGLSLVNVYICYFRWDRAFLIEVSDIILLTLFCWKLFEKHDRLTHPSSMRFVLVLLDCCSTTELVKVLFSKIVRIRKPIITSKVRLEGGKHRIRIHLPWIDRFEHSASLLQEQMFAGIHVVDF